MRKTGILLVALILLSLISGISKVSGEVSYSQLSTVGLKLGWGIKFAQRYVVKVEDVDESWTKVRIRVYENNAPVKTFILGEGKTGYYPDTTNTLFTIKVVGIWKDKEMIYIKLATPLKKLEEGLVLEEGDSYKFSSPFPSYKIKVTDVPSDSAAEFEITYPNGQTVKREIEVNSALSISYKVGELTQSSYIVVKLIKAEKNNKVVVDIYGAKVTFSNPQILKPEKEETGTTKTIQEAIRKVVYEGILYTGETLKIEYNKTEYGIRLLSVGYYSKFELIDSKGNELEKFSVREGGSYELVKAPFRIEIPPNSIDLLYNRTYIRVFGPLEATYTPIIREANVTVDLDVSEKRLLLGGDELVVFIKVKNRGRGNAFQVKVLAPIPNNFELKSGIGSWTLSTLEPFSEMPVLVYTLKPNKVGEYTLGPVIVEYYDEAGKKIIVKSNIIERIVVYGTPKVSLEVKGLTENETWSNYIETKENSTIKLRFKISASKGDGRYEFIKNATLIVDTGDFLDGKEILNLGSLEAGKEKVIDAQYLVLKRGVYSLGVTLVYQDPIGNVHKIEYPNLVLINSVPPKVIIKKEKEVIEKWPEPNELPHYIDTVLSTLSNPEPLAEKIANVSSKYLPPKENKEGVIIKVLGALTFIFGALFIVVGYLAMKYKNDLETLKAKRRKTRPGGLPKKEEKGKEEGEIKIKEV